LVGVLDLRNVAEGWVLWAFGDGGDDLSGWVVEGWMVLGRILGYTFVGMETLAGSARSHYQGYSWA
jgi:hypothetical protein